MQFALTTSSRNRSVRTRCVLRTRISALSVDKSGAFAPRIGSRRGRTRELQVQSHKLSLGWTTLGKLIPMNSQHLHLALTTPLEELLTIPQGVQLAHNVREGLEGITPEQAVAILRAINGMIESALQAERDASGDELITRDENRDVEWLMQALADENWPHSSWVAWLSNASATRRLTFPLQQWPLYWKHKRLGLTRNSSLARSQLQKRSKQHGAVASHQIHLGVMTSRSSKASKPRGQRTVAIKATVSLSNVHLSCISQPITQRLMPQLHRLQVRFSEHLALFATGSLQHVVRVA